MSKLMLMDAKHPDETRVVIVDDDTIEDFDFVTSSKAQLKGNIYLAKITRVEPSLQAAFVEYGGGKQGFLPFSEIHPDYYQIPSEDRSKLIEEELEEAQREEAAEEAEIENREKKRTGRGGRGRSRRRGGRGRDREQSEQDDGVEETGETGDETEVATDVNAAASDEDAPSGDTQPLKSDDPVVASEVVESDDASDAEESDDSEVETVSADDAEERAPRRGSAFKRYRIQEVIKRNQIVLVQVIKEERGNKGCSLTTYLSLAGRYCVLMPNSPKGGGVSRKINNGEQRRMLKEILADLREKRGFPAIIRTAGLDRTKAEIKRDYEYLVKMWTQIREDTLASTAPSLIYEESDIIKRSIRDMYTGDIEQVLVQGADAYRDCKAFMKMIMPSHAPRVKEYKEDAPIFAVHGVEAQLASMYEPEVKMPSGGYVVIQATEALISIDVNSGRSTSERNVEETAIKTNLEAAREVARQMRLRDVAGLVVIDFIDMYYGKNRRTLEKAMKDYLKHDRAKIQVGRISPFGLMELSRQRLRPSIAESSTTPCGHCQGTGFVKSLETVTIQIIRLLEREAVMGDYSVLKVASTPDVALYLLNDSRALIQEIEAQHNVSVVVSIDKDVQAGSFRLFKTGEDGRELLHQEQDDDRGRKRKGRGRRGGRNRRGREDTDGNETTDDASAKAQADDAAPKKPAQADDSDASGDEQADAKPRRSRGRGRSGARRNKNRDDKAAPAEETADASEQKAAPVAQVVSAATSADEASNVEAKDETSPAAAKPRRPRRRRASTRAAKASEEGAGDASSPAEKEDAKVVEIAPVKIEPASAPAATQEKAADLENNQPKRKGWWNRVVQGGEGDA